MIDHAAVREELEIAALEPGGLERLAAGDTAASAAIAGHLAGCPTCTEEARRLALVGPLLADIVRSIPPDDLRARTLELVRAVGEVRTPGETIRTGGEAVPAAVPDPTGVAPSRGPAPAVRPVVLPVAAAGVPTPIEGSARRPRRIAWSLAAAAVIVAFVAGGLVVGVPLAQRAATAETRAQELAALTAATQRLAGRADTTRVALTAPAGASTGAPAGSLVFSPGSQELVMVATGLQADGDRVLACWIAGPDGQRTRIGQMSLDGGLAYWTGWSETLAGAGPGTTFGVTLVDGSGRPVGPGDVLTGAVGDG